MDKCQQFIDKVSELRFLKIKERQINKFNRLLLKKQGNITWFSTVFPLGNPQADSASPQITSTYVPQAGSSWAESAAQAASASSPQTNSSQAVSSQAVSSNSSPQAESADPQAVSTSVPKQRALMPRQSVLFPKQSAIALWELAQLVLGQ